MHPSIELCSLNVEWIGNTRKRWWKSPKNALNSMRSQGLLPTCSPMLVCFVCLLSYGCSFFVLMPFIQWVRMQQKVSFSFDCVAGSLGKKSDLCLAFPDHWEYKKKWSLIPLNPSHQILPQIQHKLIWYTYKKNTESPDKDIKCARRPKWTVHNI